MTRPTLITLLDSSNFVVEQKKQGKKYYIFPINNLTQSLKAIINVIKSGVFFAIRRWTHLLWSTILMAYNRKRKLYTQSQHCINNITQESTEKEEKENNKSNFVVQNTNEAHKKKRRIVNQRFSIPSLIFIVQVHKIGSILKLCVWWSRGNIKNMKLLNMK